MPRPAANGPAVSPLALPRTGSLNRPSAPEWVVLAVLGVAFVVLCIGHRWYNDDAFITFRYASHLAHGQGFVWNVGGPRVEGTTSLGWTLLNALGIRLGLDPVLVSWYVGLASGLAGLWLAWWAARRFLALPPGWALVAPAILAGHRQYVLWFCAANETGTALVLALLATLRFALEVRADAAQDDEDPGPRRFPWSGVLFFAATLFRPEAPLLHLAAGAGLALARPVRERLVRVLRSGGLHAVLLALLTLARLAVFGAPVPNTFYAKVGALQFGLGLRYLAQFPATTFGWLWGPILVAGLVLFAARTPMPDLGVALLVQIVLLGAWVAAIGGDAWEFRFLAPVLPALAVLLAAALYAWLWLKEEPTRGRTVVLGIVALGLVGTQAATSFVKFEAKPPIVSAEDMKLQAEEMIHEGQALRAVLGPNDRIATGWAGAVPYLSGAWHFDPWGLNERDVRRWPFETQGVLFHQRHATWDDIAKRDVMFCDIYNQFIYARPFPPYGVPHPAMPWARDGVLVYCVQLGGEGECPPHGKYWIFASPRPVEDVRAWVSAKGLRLCYAQALQFRPEQPGVPTMTPAR